MKEKIENLAQLKRYIKDNEGKAYYRWSARSDGMTSIRLFSRLMSTHFVCTDEQNRQLYHYWGKACNYEFTDTGCLCKNDTGSVISRWKWTVTETEIAEYENSVQLAKEREKEYEASEKLKKEIQRIEEEKIESERLQKLQTGFLSKEKIGNYDFLKLCDLHNVNVPVRTRWFINENVEKIWLKNDESPSYSYRKEGTRSNSIWNVIEELINIIKYK